MAEQQAIFRRPENAANTREFQDARFQWDAYSTRKKQLTALLLNPNTPGRFGAKKRPTSKIEDEILDKAFPTLNVKWKDWVPKANEITLVLEAIHGRSEMLRLLNKDLDISKSKEAATYRRFYGYFEEVQLMLAAVAAGAAPARTLVIDSFIVSDQGRTEIGTQNAAASILVNPNQLNKILLGTLTTNAYGAVVPPPTDMTVLETFWIRMLALRISSKFMRHWVSLRRVPLSIQERGL